MRNGQAEDRECGSLALELLALAALTAVPALALLGWWVLVGVVA